MWQWYMPFPRSFLYIRRVSHNDVARLVGDSQDTVLSSFTELSDTRAAAIKSCNEASGLLVQLFTETRQMDAESCWHTNILLRSPVCSQVQCCRESVSVCTLWQTCQSDDHHLCNWVICTVTSCLYNYTKSTKLTRKASKSSMYIVISSSVVPTINPFWDRELDVMLLCYDYDNPSCYFSLLGIFLFSSIL